jgi:hypothetical protein
VNEICANLNSMPSSCFQKYQAVCGDGFIDYDEQCDNNNSALPNPTACNPVTCQVK